MWDLWGQLDGLCGASLRQLDVMCGDSWMRFVGAVG